MTINLQNFFRYFDKHNQNHIEAVKILDSKIPSELKQPSSEWVAKFRGGNASGLQVVIVNFFTYFSEKVQNHVDSVNILQKSLPSELLQDNSEWVKKFREKPPTPSEINLNVPYYNQVDNYTIPYSSCNSSSCAMCLQYLKPGTLVGSRGDDEYLQKVLSIGASEDHTVQTEALNSYGVKSHFSYNLSFADLDKSLSAGKPVVIGILHRGTLSNPTGGHMVVVRGKTAKGDYYVNDPYGSLNDNYTGPVENGKNTVYSREQLSYRWLDNGQSGTGWGRIFD